MEIPRMEMCWYDDSQEKSVSDTDKILSGEYNNMFYLKGNWYSCIIIGRPGSPVYKSMYTDLDIIIMW